MTMLKLDQQLHPLYRTDGVDGMQNKARLAIKHCLAYALWLFLGFAAVQIQAGEVVKHNTIPKITNVGFMKNPPTALKEKFPMCDVFLNVEWIDKKKRIGYSHFDIYDGQGNKVPPQAFALIDLDENYPSYDYSMAKYLQHTEASVEKFKYLPNENLNELFAFIRNGEIDRTTSALRITNSKTTISFIPIAAVRDEDLHIPNAYDGSLSGYRLNVCIPYPDNKLMWIAEQRRIENTYSKEEAAKLFAKLKSLVPQAFQKETLSIGNGFVLDINFDGIDDYFLDGLVYSSGTKYYVAEPLWASGLDKEYGQWRFPPSQKKCGMHTMVGHLNLTTDGGSYFAGDQCNLTDLTKKGE